MLSCRICKSNNLKKIFSLGKQPIANNLLALPTKVQTYPLDLWQCNHCTLIQIGYIIPRTNLYDTYFYIPSVSKTHLAHFEKLAQSLIKDLQLKKGDLVVDIGSSDGSLLTCFEKRGMKVIGVEPAQNIKSSVDTIRAYFSRNVAMDILNQYGKAKLVTATNVFAHIKNLASFIGNITYILAEDGVFFAQFPDVRNLLKENQFDTIYHEHLSYFTHEPLYHLFSNSLLELFRIDSDAIHGGSMRIYVRKRKPLLKDFIKNVERIKRTLRKYILEQHEKGKIIVGFGAAAKGTVLLNYCGLDNTLIAFVADGTSYKQGKYIPGVNIPVITEKELYGINPDIVLILAWNFKEEIMKKLKGKGYTFVIPIPKVEIIQS